MNIRRTQGSILDISGCHLGDKILKGKIKRLKCIRKRKKGEENEKRESQRVK
jgi:hypothetical protein